MLIPTILFVNVLLSPSPVWLLDRFGLVLQYMIILELNKIQTGAPGFPPDKKKTPTWKCQGGSYKL
jgi:hypothetical protein